MIHEVVLPETTCNILMRVVRMQIRLLYFAANAAGPIEEKDCAKSLFETSGLKEERSNRIASWIWNAERDEKLQGFAQEKDCAKKHKFVAQMHNDVLKLRWDATGYIETVLHTYEWQKCAADFLRRFYTDFRSSSGLPWYLFSSSKKDNFTGQTFLDAFLMENKELYVCPMCDATTYYTSNEIHVKANVKRKVYTTIEHYFPRADYPHLSCHPYNLLPLCSLCNSIHGDADPLQLDKKDASTRLPLDHIALPYRGQTLGSKTSLSVKLAPEKNFAELGKLVPRQEYKNPALKKQIDNMKRIYKIPDRWNEYENIDKVGDTLFRRMRQWLRGMHEIPSGDKLEYVILNFLDPFLYTLYEKEGGDSGKDAYTFAMAWLLTQIVIEEEDRLEKQAIISGDIAERLPFLAEISQWLGQNLHEKGEYAKVAKMLKMIVKENISSSNNEM